MKIDVIFAIASGQPDPLILPFLSPEIGCKHLILLVSDWSKKNAIDLNIKTAIQPLGIKVDTVDLISDGWNDIQMLIEKTLFKYPESKIAFNANGGTKPMTLAAFEYCYNNDIPVFYVDKHKLDWLYPPHDSNFTSINIEKSLSITNYLNAHGYQVISTKETLNSRELKALVRDWSINEDKSAIGSLNYLASKERVKNLKVTLTADEASDNSNVCSYLDDLDRDGLIDLNLTNNSIRFKSEESRFFINGGWYELYIVMLLQQINKKHFDGKGSVISNMEVKPSKKLSKTVKNEIDVAFLLNNRLYLFECKTANLSSKQGRADEAIYKLGTILHELGGLHAKGCIMSYRDIKQLDKDRAKLLNIDIIEHTTSEESMENKLYSFIK